MLKVGDTFGMSDGSHWLINNIGQSYLWAEKVAPQDVVVKEIETQDIGGEDG